MVSCNYVSVNVNVFHIVKNNDDCFYPLSFLLCLPMTDLPLKILKSDKSCPGAAQMIDWLKGVFDALDKKYVSLSLIVLYFQLQPT